MKKFFLFTSLMISIIGANGQSGTDCKTSKAIKSRLGFSNQQQVQQSQWYIHIAEFSQENFKLLNRSGNADNAFKMTLWGGTCPSGLIALNSDTLTGPSDSILFFSDSSLVVGDTFYLQVEKMNTVDVANYFLSVNHQPAGGCPGYPLTCELVLNSSLDDYTFPPTTFSQLSNSCYYNNPTSATPDYLDSLGYSGWPNSVATPSNMVGIQVPHSGTAYAGIVTYDNLGTWSEYVMGSVSNLFAGYTYKIQFYVSMADSVGFASNNIGAWVTDFGSVTPYSALVGQIPEVPQASSGATPITNATGWTLVSGSFVATGLEDQIVIGQFGGTSVPLSSPTPSVHGATIAYYYIDDISIQLDDSLIVSALDTNICVGDTTVLTAFLSSGGIAYNWYPSTGLSDPTVQSPLAFPNDTTLYYVEVTDTNGCVTKDSFLLFVNPIPDEPVFTGNSTTCSAGGFTYTITNYDSTLIYSVDFILSNGTATAVDSLGEFTVTWINPTLIDTIVVTATTPAGCSASSIPFAIDPCCTGSGTFIFNDSTSNLVPSSSTTSVTIVSGGTYFVNGTLIVDTWISLINATVFFGSNAKIIVRGIGGASTIFSIRNSTLENGCGRMWDGIYIDGFTNPGNSFEMVGSNFRDAINGVVSQNRASFKINQNCVFDKNRTAITVLPFAGIHTGLVYQSRFECSDTLLAPFGGLKSEYGILIKGSGTQQGTIKIGRSNSLSEQNLFTTGLKNGIRSVNTNVRVVNCKFTNINVPTFGKAIWSVGRIPGGFNLNQYSLIVGGNAPNEPCIFNNNGYGIYTDTCIASTISYDTIRNSIFMAISSNNTKGLLQNVNIHHNYIRNARVGISAYMNTNCNTQIKNNDISMPGSSAITSGVVITDVNSNNGKYTIFNNDIDQVKVGVRSNSVKLGKVDGNRITVKPSGGPAKGVWVTNNTQPKVTSNIITCSPPQPTNLNMLGVYLQDCPSSLVRCNIVSQFGACIRFDGPANTPGTVFGNDMQLGTYGLWLNNGPALGPQGSLTIASDNKWTGVFTGHTHTTGSIVTVGNNSKLFYRPLGTYIPINNTFAGLGTPMAPQVVSGSPPLIHCAYPIPGLFATNALKQVALGQITYPSAELKWLNKHSAFRTLKSDSSLFAGDSVLINFSDSLETENLGKLYNVLSTIADNDSTTNFSTVQADNNLIPTSDNIEVNMKTVASMMVDHRLNGLPFNSAEQTYLRDLAVLCPYTDGTAVYLARALLKFYDLPNTEYENSCESEEGRAMLASDFEEVANPFLLFPNPNNGEMTLSYSLKETDAGRLIIYDVTGRILNTYNLDPSLEQMRISEADLSNGIYLYKIYVNEKPVQSNRIVIVK